MRHLLAALICSALLVGCGGDDVTFAEYIGEVEVITNTMYERIDAVTIRMSVESPTVENIKAAYRDAADAFRDLSEGLGSLEPPPEAAATHASAVEFADELMSASRTFSERVNQVGTEAELDQLFMSPDAEAFFEAQNQIVAFCQEQQAELDAEADREGLADVPWIPPEMKEVVLAAFGCDRPDPFDP